MYDQIMESQRSASGSAIEENQEYLKSFEARLAQTRRNIEELSLSLGDAFLNESMVMAIESFGKGAEMIADFTDKFGALPLLFSTVSLGVILLSKNVRTWIQAMAFGSAEITKNQRELIGLEDHLKRTDVATKAFQRTWRSLVVSAGVGLGTMILGWGFEKVLSKMAEARQRAEDLRNEFENSKRIYKENADEIDKLVQEYERLNSLTGHKDLTQDERTKASKDMLEVQERLAEIMPEIVVTEDEYGNKIYQSSGYMSIKNELLKQEIELAKEKAEIEAREGQEEKLKEDEKNLKKYNKELEATIKNIQGFSNVASNIAFGDKDFLKVDASDLNSVNEAIKMLKEQMSELNKSDQMSVQTYIDSLEQQAFNLGKYQNQIASTQMDITTIYGEQLKEIINNSQTIGQSSQEVMNSLALLTSQLGLTKEQTKQIFDDLGLAVVVDEELQSFANAFDIALRNLETSSKNHDLTPSVANKEKLETDMRVVESAFTNLKNKLLEIMQSTDGFDSSMFDEMSGKLDALLVKFIEGKISLEEFSKATGIPMTELQNNLAMISGGLEDVTDSAETATTSIKELNDKLEAVGGVGTEELGEIKKSFEDINQVTDDLLTSLELYKYTLEDATQAEIDHVNALIETGYQKDQLTIKELELTQALEGEEKAIQELLARYPHLFTAEEMARLSKDELIAKIKEEMLAQDLLIGGMELVAKGQASEQDSRNINTFRGTRFRINQYRDELRALKALQGAMQQHYENAYNIYTETKKLAPGTANEAMAEHEALIAHQSLSQKNLAKINTKIIDKEIQLNAELDIQSQQMESLARISGILSGATSNYGKQLDKAQKAQEKGTKGSKSNTKAKKDNAKATKSKAEAEEMASFIADKYKRAIEQVTLALKEQNAIKSQFPKHSKEYRDALAKEIELEKHKLELMQSQKKEMQDNIASGVVPQTGVVSLGTKDKPAIQPKVQGAVTNRKLSGWQARVNSGYGYRNHPTLGGRRMHAGVDMAQPLGTKLEANIEGIVKRAFYDKQGYGNVIYVVDNSGVEHRYAHLSKIAVKQGQRVGVGDYLGNIGSTGRSTGPHLHYETWKNGKHMNPMAYVNQAKGIQAIAQTAAKDVHNVNKEVAQTASGLYGLQSEILGLQGEIIDQQVRLQELQLEILRSELAVFEKQRSQFGWEIDYGLSKRELQRQNFERYAESILEQTILLQKKQDVNKDEMMFLKALIDSEQLQGNALEEITQRYQELSIAINNTTLEIANLKKEQIDNQLLRWVRGVEDYEYQIALLDQTLRANEEGTHAWNQANQETIQLLSKKRNLIKREIEELTQLLRVTEGLSPQAIRDYELRLRELTLAYRELGLTIEDTNKMIKDAEERAWGEIADKVIDAYKNAIREKQEAHLKSIDEELKAENDRHKTIMENYRNELQAFRDIVNEKIKAINKEDEQRTYDDEMAELDKDRAEILRQMQLLKMDDSRDAKYRRKKLQEDLNKIDKTIEDKRYKREKDLRIEELNEVIKDKEKEVEQKEKLENDRHEAEKQRIDDLREYWNQHYTDLLNDERKFAKMREDIMNQNFANIEREFSDLIEYLTDTMPDLENTLNGTMEAVGTAIRQNIIDELKNALQLMTEFSEKLESGSGSGIDLSEGLPSGSSPSTPPHKGDNRYYYSDMQVIAGKMIRHNLSNEGRTNQEKKLIQIAGSDLANLGREHGSQIDDTISFDSIVKQMTKDEIWELADMLEEYAYSLPADQAFLRDLLEREAERLQVSARFDTGGLI